MALSKEKAIDAVRAILSGARADEEPRLDRIARALRPATQYVRGGDGSALAYDASFQPASFPVETPKNAPDVMLRLALKAETNFLPLVVDTFSQVMKVQGYFSSSVGEDGRSTGMVPSTRGWDYWQRNRMDARQTGIHRSALTYGAAYTSVLPGDKGPVIKGYSPRRMTAVYGDPEYDEWPMLALDVDGQMLRLFDEEGVYYLGAENVPRGLFESGAGNRALLASRLDFIEFRAHDAGVCPIVRYRDRMLLDGEEQFGIVEPLFSMQARINETGFGRLVGQFFAAFKQRYVVGWVPKSEADEMRAGASEVWYFDDPDVKVGQFDETDLTRYIEAKASDLRDLAAIAQVPAQNLGIDAISNISAETLAGLEAGKERKTDEITTSFGESHEQTLRLCAHIDGDPVGAGDYASQVRWKDQTARSFAQAVDGLGKLATMLEVPKELLWEKIPEWTDTDVKRAVAMRQAQPSDTALLVNALNRQTQPTVPPVVPVAGG